MKRNPRFVISLPLALLTGLASCRTLAPDPNAPTNLVACTEFTAVSIGTGPTPSVAWTPNCGLGAVFFYAAGDSLPIWVAVSRDNQMPSPITYGTAPRTGYSYGTAVPLQVGELYRIRWALASPLEPGHPVTLITPLGEQEFTP